MIWDWSYAAECFPAILEASVVTLQAALLGFAIASVLGLVLALVRRSDRWVLSYPVGVVIEFIRSTPILVQLYLFYFGLPALGIDISPFWTGVLTLGLHASTYLSEVYRAGLEAVPRGQWEAAQALNYGRAGAMAHIVLPQAIPPVIPGLGNYLILILKDTPLLSAIAVVEMLQVAKTLGSQSFRYLEPLTIVGVMFIVMSLIAAGLVRQLEQRAREMTQ